MVTQTDTITITFPDGTEKTFSATMVTLTPDEDENNEESEEE